MSELECKMEIPEVPGLESQKLTVGRIFYYRCAGEWPRGFQVDSVQLQVSSEPKGTPYDLRLLGFEFRDPKTAELMLVSYRPGAHNFSQIKITDGTSSLDLAPFSLEVGSVLNPNEKTEPFGPQGPMPLSVPWTYWVLLVAVLGVLVFSGLLVWKRRADRRRTLAEIKRRTTSPSPLIQFHRELRILTKKAGLADIDHQLKIKPEDYLKDLRSLCEIFWGQKFNVALLHHETRKLKTEFRSQSPKAYVRFRKELLFWNQRWENLFQGAQKARFEDFQEFTLSTRELIEKMAEEEM